MGYGKDSLIDCLERVYRVKLEGAKAADLAGSYPDAGSQRATTAVVHAAREVVRRNFEHFEGGRAPVCTASFGAGGITVHDPLTGTNNQIFRGAI
jgi:hypothetical protein